MSSHLKTKFEWNLTFIKQICVNTFETKLAFLTFSLISERYSSPKPGLWMRTRLMKKKEVDEIRKLIPGSRKSWSGKVCEEERGKFRKPPFFTRRGGVAKFVDAGRIILTDFRLVKSRWRRRLMGGLTWILSWTGFRSLKTRWGWLAKKPIYRKKCHFV